MKIRNKKSGEIGKIGTVANLDGTIIVVSEDDEHFIAEFDSLEKLNEYWEDYEEPKSGIEDIRFNDMISGRHIVEIDFTKVEEAEKAVEKLKAWKRLRDKGLTIKCWHNSPDMNLTTGSFIEIKGLIPRLMENLDDLDLVFGGEE